jgi:hypothetical protein
MQQQDTKQIGPVMPVSTGRARRDVTPDSPAQEVINAVYKKGHGPADARGLEIARGILWTSQRAEALRARRTAR